MLRPGNLKGQSRQVVVDSMSKKLASHSDSDFAVRQKPRDMRIMIFAVAGAVILVACMIFFMRPSKKADPIPVSGVPAVLGNPVWNLKAAYESRTITVDQYGKYLCDVLTRYDSLPDQFRIDRPLVRDADVFAELRDIWPRISYELRKELLSSNPGLEQKIGHAKSHSTKTNK